MTATAVNIPTPNRNAQKQAPAPVAATTHIHRGVECCLNSSGYLIEAAATSGNIYYGVSAEEVDNSLGANGALSCACWVDGEHEFISSGLAITDVGKQVYIKDNQTVRIDTATVDVKAGNISEYISATRCMVNIQKDSQGKGR